MRKSQFGGRREGQERNVIFPQKEKEIELERSGMEEILPMPMKRESVSWSVCLSKKKSKTRLQYAPIADSRHSYYAEKGLRILLYGAKKGDKTCKAVAGRRFPEELLKLGQKESKNLHKILKKQEENKV